MTFPEKAFDDKSFVGWFLLIFFFVFLLVLCGAAVNAVAYTCNYSINTTNIPFDAYGFETHSNEFENTTFRNVTSGSPQTMTSTQTSALWGNISFLNPGFRRVEYSFSGGSPSSTVMGQYIAAFRRGVALGEGQVYTLYGVPTAQKNTSAGCSGSTYSCPANSDDYTTFIADINAFIGNLTLGYDGVHNSSLDQYVRVELWNEPYHFFMADLGTTDANAYTRVTSFLKLVNKTNVGIHAVFPNVAVGLSCGYYDGYSGGAFNNFANDCLTNASALNIPYDMINPHEYATLGGAGSAGTLYYQINYDVAQIQAKVGVNHPIVFTEAGFHDTAVNSSAGNDVQQVGDLYSFLTQIFQDNTNLTGFTWYELISNGMWPYPNANYPEYAYSFHLMMPSWLNEPNDAYRPAYWAFANVTRILRNSTLVSNTGRATNENIVCSNKAGHFYVGILYNGTSGTSSVDFTAYINGTNATNVTDLNTGTVLSANATNGLFHMGTWSADSWKEFEVQFNATSSGGGGGGGGCTGNDARTQSWNKTAGLYQFDSTNCTNSLTAPPPSRTCLGSTGVCS